MNGTEKNCCLPIEKLKETNPFKEEIDAAFYTAVILTQELTLGEGYFVIYYPQDGHMPGIIESIPEIVKKVVVKVLYS